MIVYVVNFMNLDFTQHQERWYVDTLLHLLFIKKGYPMHSPPLFCLWYWRLCYSVSYTQPLQYYFPWNKIQNNPKSGLMRRRRKKNFFFFIWKLCYSTYLFDFLHCILIESFVWFFISLPRFLLSLKVRILWDQICSEYQMILMLRRTFWDIDILLYGLCLHTYLDAGECISEWTSRIHFDK